MAINSKALFVPNALVSLVAGPWSTCLEADHTCSAWGYRGGSGWGSVRRLRHKWLQECANIRYRSLTFLRHSGLKDVITQPHEVWCWEYRNSSLILERGLSPFCCQSVGRPVTTQKFELSAGAWSPGVCRRLELEALPTGFVVNFELKSGVLWFDVFC